MAQESCCSRGAKAAAVPERAAKYSLAQKMNAWNKKEEVDCTRSDNNTVGL